jgi:hypothetical protein
MISVASCRKVGSPPDNQRSVIAGIVRAHLFDLCANVMSPGAIEFFVIEAVRQKELQRESQTK